MLRYRSLLLLLPLLSLSACSCDTVQVARANGALVLVDTNVDFGQACLNSTAHRPFVIANHGSGPLNLESIEFSRDEFTLLEDVPEFLSPGQELVLELGFTPSSEGDYAGTLTIVTDAPNDATQMAPLFGKGFDGKDRDLKVRCEEDSKEDCYLVNLKDVLVNAAAEKTFYMSNLGCENLNVNEAYFTSEDDEDIIRAFSLDKEVPFRIRGGETLPVTIYFSSPRDDGPVMTRLVLKTDDPEVKIENRGWEEGEWQLTTLANVVKPDLETDVDLLTFFDSNQGETVSKSFRIINNGSSELEILDVALVHEDGLKDYKLELPNGLSRFTLPPLSINPGENEREVTVVYTASGAGSARARVDIDGGSQKASVRLRGGMEPTLVVNWFDPEEDQWRVPPVHFGNTDTGVSGVERTVRLVNTGRADLVVSDLELVDLPVSKRSYVVPSWSGKLAPGQSHDFTVTFNDNVQVRNDHDQIAVVTNDPLHENNGGIYVVDLVSINEPNLPPVVLISAPSTPTVGDDVILDGSGSIGPEPGDSLSYEWTIRRQPDDSYVELQSPNAPETRVISRPPNASSVCPSSPGPTCPWPFRGGQYTFRLVVTDQFGNQGFRDQVIQLFEN